VNNISASHIEKNFSYDKFIPYLKRFFEKDVNSPQRPHYSIPGKNQNATLLLMPSWDTENYIGVKVVNVFPDNERNKLPTVQGIYLLMDKINGKLLTTIDGPTLTTKRTAAMSALAADILSKKSNHSMLMIGTGKLSGELIKAHCSVRDINKVFIWGRNKMKADKKVKEIESILRNVRIESVATKDEAISQCNLISAATLSNTPLIKGGLLCKGAHIDLVGSFTPESREADDHCISRSSVFVDDYGAMNEAGDIFIPLENKTMKPEDVLMDLTELVKSGYHRKSEDEITLFKSAGNAKADLALAVYLYESSNK